MQLLGIERVHPHDHFPRPRHFGVAPEERPQRVRIAIFNPRNTGLFPAISGLRDGEMCGSAVFLYLGAEDAGINKGIRKVGPKGAARGYGAMSERSRDVPWYS